MLLIGLTGGIASGKSTVARYFADLGITVIDTDQLARKFVAPHTKEFAQIITHFGPEILDENQQLRRDKLRQIIFKNPKQREWLENLLHPLILKEMFALTKTATSPYCILEIPLLLEKNVPVDRILVVDTTPKLQIERLQQSTKMTLEEINSILQSQLSREKKLAQADDVIYNQSSLTELQQQVHNLHQKYLIFTASNK